jgi:hypothetical protein
MRVCIKQTLIQTIPFLYTMTCLFNQEIKLAFEYNKALQAFLSFNIFTFCTYLLLPINCPSYAEFTFAHQLMNMFANKQLSFDSATVLVNMALFILQLP